MRKSREPGDAPKGGGSRAERLEAELKANLKRRKEQARARARSRPAPPAGPANDAEE
jgi:hypothetical protein